MSNTKKVDQPVEKDLKQLTAEYNFKLAQIGQLDVQFDDMKAKKLELKKELKELEAEAKRLQVKQEVEKAMKGQSTNQQEELSSNDPQQSVA